jgi:sec-independent protein translocase protein TatB
MFNVGVGEIVLILIAALVLLGPERLPEAARTLGKFMREFRRQTDEVRGVVMREMYKMERELDLTETAAKPAPKALEVKSGEQTISILPASGAVARGVRAPESGNVPPPGNEPAPVSVPMPEGPAAKETGS